jgi:four helix bundle protein
MDKKELQKRFKALAIKTARLCFNLPFNFANKVYIDQITRSSVSSAANYRSACRAKSKADFVNKLKTVGEELDETMFFYEMIAEFNSDPKSQI